MYKLENSQVIIAACAVLHNIGRIDRNFEDAFFAEEEMPILVSKDSRRGNALRTAFIKRHFD